MKQCLPREPRWKQSCPSSVRRSATCRLPRHFNPPRRRRRTPAYLHKSEETSRTRFSCSTALYGESVRDVAMLGCVSSPQSSLAVISVPFAETFTSNRELFGCAVRISPTRRREQSRLGKRTFPRSVRRRIIFRRFICDGVLWGALSERRIDSFCTQCSILLCFLCWKLRKCFLK